MPKIQFFEADLRLKELFVQCGEEIDLRNDPHT